MGIGSYARNLLAALGRSGGDIDYVLLANSFRSNGSGLAAEFAPGGFSVRNPRLPAVAWRWLIDRWGVPIELLCGEVAVFHALDPVAPETRAATCVATVHDLIDFALPELYPGAYLSTHQSRRHYAERQRLLRKTLRRADRLIAVSESTRHDLVAYLDIPQEKISTIPYGIEPGFHPIDEEARQAVLARYGVTSSGFLLSVGRMEHRKNVRSILEAMSLLRGRSRRRRKLVVCGWPGRPVEVDQELRRIDELGLREDVTLVEYVAHADLPAFYSAASATLYPSLYEGFGLPPLESMACGTPVIASKSSSVPEVVGDAAICVDAADVEALAAAIERVCQDEAVREELRARGAKRAALFSWERAARSTLQIYREFE